MEDIHELAQTKSEEPIAKSEELIDSISIGSASKGGVVKIYGRFEDPEDFKKKVDAAAEVRAYAHSKLLV